MEARKQAEMGNFYQPEVTASVGLKGWASPVGEERSRMCPAYLSRST